MGHPITGTARPIRAREGDEKESFYIARGSATFLRTHGWLAAALALLLLGTRGFYLGDTTVYTAQIVQYVGKSPVGSGNLLWEFGHLLWRPLGWLLVQIGGPAMAAVMGWETSLICAFALISVNVIAGVLTILLWHSMILEFTRSRVTAFLISLAFACSNAFLTYIHSGSSYIPGLFCVTASTWLLRRTGGARTTGLWAGALLAALAPLLWFPYMLSIPGILFIALWPFPGLGRRPRPERVRLAARVSVIVVMCVALGYGFGAWARRIGTIPQARAWIAESSHGWSQSQRPLRLTTGLPRTLLFMGQDGILYRRFLVKDPYARVSVADLVKASLWKIMAFALFVLCLLWEMWRTRPARWVRLLVLVGAAPVLVFAVFVFEPGSPERYFPAYPFAILAIAWALRDFPAARRVPQYAMAGFLVAMSATNIYSMARPRIDRQDIPSIQRLAPLKARLRSGSLVAILSNQDTIEQFCNRAPFADVNRPVPLRLYDVIEPATVRLLTWREEFAREALQAWAQGGDVWVSKRLWQSKPLPEWNWVEGDDSRISWKDIPPFFAPLQTDAETRGRDGFLRVQLTNANVSRLSSFAANGLGAIGGIFTRRQKN